MCRQVFTHGVVEWTLRVHNIEEGPHELLRLMIGAATTLENRDFHFAFNGWDLANNKTIGDSGAIGYALSFLVSQAG